ncbi:MAG TPA: hypothetical protein VND22_04110 [Actinomycetota bacterium]|nr:hypothetical protein [Actinomycetota bacterium]
MFDEKHYEAEVNEKDINMRNLTDEMNDRWKDGWRFLHAWVHNNNTIIVWERREEAASK